MKIKIVVIKNDDTDVTLVNRDRDQDQRLFIVKIGNDMRPASEKDLIDFADCLRKALKGKGTPIIISHHAVSIEVVQLLVDEA